MNRCRIAVVIPTYQREGVLVDTIRQVLAQDPMPDEVLIVDQTPQHEAETEQALSEWQGMGRIRWIRHSPPSLCGARNRAVLETSCEIVLFLDDDLDITCELVGRHLANFLDPETTAVTGPTEGPDSFRNDLSYPVTCAILDQGGKAEGFGWLRGCNFSVRIDAVKQCGGFDENYIASANYEENDFAQRLIKQGGNIVYDPASWVYHLKHPAGGCRLPGNKTNPEWTKSVNFFIFRFRYSGLSQSLRRTAWEVLRSGPLRKENVKAPWRWPLAWASFAYAAWEGWRRANSPVSSPFSAQYGKQT